MRLIFLGTQFYYMLWFHSNDIFGEERGRKPHSSGVNADYFPKPVLGAKGPPQTLSPLVRKTPSLTSLLLLHHPQGLAPQSPFGAVPQEKGTCETRLLCCTSLAGEAFPILTTSRLSWIKLIKLLIAPAWQIHPARDRGLGGERVARRAATGRAGGTGGQLGMQPPHSDTKISRVTDTNTFHLSGARESLFWVGSQTIWHVHGCCL